MTGVATASAWLLAGVFAWSGSAKLARRQDAVASFRALGLPSAGTLAPALAVVELAAALLLLVRPAAGGAVALLLLVAFSGFVADRFRRGVAVPCACFGGSASMPLSWATLVRNGMLGGLAVIALGASTPGAPALAEVLAVGAAAAAGLVVHALAELRAATGRLWDNRLETGPGAGA